MSDTSVISKMSSLMSVLNSAGLSGSKFGKSASFINSVFGTGYSIYSGYASGDTDSQVQSTMSIVSLLTNLLKKFICNETSTATSEVAKSKSSLVKNNEILTKFADTDITEIDTAIAAVEEQLVQIQAIMEKMTADSKQAAEKQKEIKEQQRIITENVDKINNSKDESGKPDANVVQEAKTAITDACTKLSDYCTEITTMESNIQNYQKSIDNASDTIETNLNSAQKEVLKLANEIEGVTVKQATETTATTVTMSTEATTNESVAAAATATAAGAGTATVFTFNATSTIAVKAGRVAADQAGAGAIRIAGIADNMTGLGSFLANGTSEMAKVGTYATTIGQAAASSSILIAEANILSNTLNTAVGVAKTTCADALQVAYGVLGNTNNTGDTGDTDNSDNEEVVNFFYQNATQTGGSNGNNMKSVVFNDYFLS